MENNYLCPKCNAYLNVGENIILTAKNRCGDKGIVLLSPELGNYRIEKHPFFIIKEGDHVNLYCPSCGENLAARNLSDNLAKMIMIDQQENEYEIYFSEIAGEHCTYKIKEGILESFGGDSTVYVNHFGEVPHY